jgi:CheY-like chemotaxis protein
VLIVEDEFLVRIGTRAAVEIAGFDVLEAGDTDEAIAILATRNDIHLVFTDVHMPGSMDGLKLAHFVRDRWPPRKSPRRFANSSKASSPASGAALLRPLVI